MTFFEIFNKVMLELNYRKITVFENIFKSEHLRILENINRVNLEVTKAFDWPFLLKKKELTVPSDTVEAPEMISGRVVSVYSGARKLKFNPFYERFFNDTATSGTYGAFGDCLLFPRLKREKKYLVYYNSNKVVKGSDGTLKENFTLKDDETVIPMPFAEQILVYGACIRTKANPSFPKFAFWNAMFKEALIKLRSTSGIGFEDVPVIKLNSKL